MDKFLERHKLKNMTITEVENLSRPMTSKRIKLVILKLPTKKIPTHMTPLVNSIKYLKNN